MRVPDSGRAPAHRRPPGGRGYGRAGRDDSAGFTLVTLVVLAVVLNVMIAAALPSVTTAIQREKEEELIFRGLQYAEAIRVFQLRNGRYPVSLEELVEIHPRAARQLWADPMTRGGGWGLIYATAPGQSGRGLGAVSGTGTSPLGVSAALAQTQDALEADDQEEADLDDEAPDNSQLSRSERRIRRRAALGGTQGGGPIIGVHSLSEEKALKSFNGGSKYSDWKFTAELLPSGAVTGENVPRMNAAFVGRPLPQGVELSEASGLEDDEEGPAADESSRERRRRERQERRERRQREREGGGG